VAKANVEILVQAKDQASKQLKGITGQLQGMRKQIRMAGMAMTAAGGAILAAGILSVRTYAKMGDEVQKMALRTGFSTEALSELRHAAEISGTSLESLEKAVKKMAKTVMDAKDGLATYVRAFDRIGLSAEDLIELAPEEQFDKIAMAIAAVENPTIRAATAQEIFGRAGTQLLPMLAQGAEELRELREEAHKLGIVFDQEAANAAAEFNDALTRLNAGMTGIKNEVGGALIPTLMTLIDTMTGVTENIIAWSKENPILSSSLTAVVSILGGLSLGVGAFVLAMDGAVALAGALGISLFALLPILALVTAGLGAVTFGILQLVQNSQIQKKVTKDLAEVEREYIKMLAGKVNNYNELIIAYAENIKMREAMGRAAESEIQWLEQNTEAIKALRAEQTLQSEIAMPEVLGATVALTGANMALAGSYGTVAGMARSAWNEMSKGTRAAGLAGYYEKMGYSGQELKAMRAYGQYVGAQPFGALDRLPPSLYRPGTFTGRELASQINVAVYLDGAEIGGNVISHIEEDIRSQGGL